MAGVSDENDEEDYQPSEDYGNPEEDDHVEEEDEDYEEPDWEGKQWERMDDTSYDQELEQEELYDEVSREELEISLLMMQGSTVEEAPKLRTTLLTAEDTEESDDKSAGVADSSENEADEESTTSAGVDESHERFSEARMESSSRRSTRATKEPTLMPKRRDM